MHLARGSLRIFKYFSASGFFYSQAESTPALRSAGT